MHLTALIFNWHRVIYPFRQFKSFVQFNIHVGGNEAYVQMPRNEINEIHIKAKPDTREALQIWHKDSSRVISETHYIHLHSFPGDTLTISHKHYFPNPNPYSTLKSSEDCGNRHTENKVPYRVMSFTYDTGIIYLFFKLLLLF